MKTLSVLALERAAELEAEVERLREAITAHRERVTRQTVALDADRELWNALNGDAGTAHASAHDESETPS